MDQLVLIVNRPYWNRFLGCFGFSRSFPSHNEGNFGFSCFSEQTSRTQRHIIGRILTIKVESIFRKNVGFFYYVCIFDRHSLVVLQKSCKYAYKFQNYCPINFPNWNLHNRQYLLDKKERSHRSQFSLNVGIFLNYRNISYVPSRSPGVDTQKE